MTDEERIPKCLTEHECVECCGKFENNCKLVHPEGMGHGIMPKFVRTLAGRIFQFPETIFSERILSPEKQDMDILVGGIYTILQAYTNAAFLVAENTEFVNAIRLLRAMLHIANDA
jgi:hypothetical protein